MPETRAASHAPAQTIVSLLRFRPGGLTQATRRVGGLPRVYEIVGVGRIRLVAYGARLESVLGASPRGFESPILRWIFER
jgi:hypothetical protein